MFSPSFRPGLCWFAEHCRNTQVRQWLYGTQYMTGTHHLLLGLRGFTEPLHLCFNVILGQPFNFIQINILFPPKKSSAKSFIYLLTWQTRTHSMARHRKSSRSLRNLMVIGPLTPTQGDQFERRLIFFSVSWSTDHPLNLICHITMFRKLNFWPLSKARRDRDPKICAGACAIHVSNSHTKSGWISEKKNFWPQPPTVPPSPTPGHDPGGQMKIPSDVLYKFHLWEDTQSLV